MSGTRQIIQTTRAKSQGERLAHHAVRLPFLQHVLVDPRTRDLFEHWGSATGIDVAIATYSWALDSAAAEAGFEHRRLLHRNQAALQRLPRQTRAALLRTADRGDDLIQDTKDARAAEVIAFVREDLLHDPKTPMCAWLGLDLLDMFDAEVLGHIWDEKIRLPVVVLPVRGRVPKGQRPKNDGEHLAQYATWFYQACVADPRTSEHELAREYDAQQEAKGIYRKGDERDRPRISPVQYGIKEARRLLELPIAPQHWLREYFQK